MSAAVPLAVLKVVPRVKKLRFNLEEFAKSDFFKIFGKPVRWSSCHCSCSCGLGVASVAYGGSVGAGLAPVSRAYTAQSSLPKP